MNLFVRVLPKEICLQIARIIGDPSENEASLLFYLPDHVFGKVFAVKYCEGTFKIDDPDEPMGWNVPAFFCKFVDRDKPKEV